MKKLLLTATCLALLGAAPMALALAQDEHRPEGGHPEGGGHPGGGGGGPRPGGEPHSAPMARPQEQPRAVQVRPSQAARPETAPAQHETHRQGAGPSGPGAARPESRDYHQGGPGHQGGPSYQGSRGGPGAHNGGGARPAAVMALRRNVQAQRHFNGGDYRAPPGYRHQHWGYGQRLPGAYYARNYWITDYLAYSLFAPPDGLVWVRVGPDALLIDQYSGEIIQVDYGLFY